MTDAASAHHGPLCLKYLTSAQVRAQLARDPRLIVPVGTTEQHGPHLPLGCDTIIVERLADDLSAEFGVLRAPAIEYGVNARTEEPSFGRPSLASADAGDRLYHLILDRVATRVFRRDAA